MDERRIGGLAGFGFVFGIALQNGVLLAGNPLPGAPLDEIAAFYAGRPAAIAIAVGWVALNVPLLFVFATVASRALEEAGRGLWGRVAWSGVCLLVAAFATTTWLQAVLAARAAELLRGGLLQLVWDLHSAAFAMSAIGLATTMGALSIGSREGELVPRWTAGLGLAGTACLVGAGTLVVPTVAGGPAIFLQLAGFATWVVWLLAASTRLVRPRAIAVRPSPAP